MSKFAAWAGAFVYGLDMLLSVGIPTNTVFPNAQTVTAQRISILSDVDDLNADLFSASLRFVEGVARAATVETPVRRSHEGCARQLATLVVKTGRSKGMRGCSCPLRSCNLAWCGNALLPHGCGYRVAARIRCHHREPQRYADVFN